MCGPARHFTGGARACGAWPRRVSFTSDPTNGHVTITLTGAAGPGKYTSGLRSAFWSPDDKWVVADDGRILTAQNNPLPDDSHQAGFAVTYDNLLPRLD